MGMDTILTTYLQVSQHLTQHFRTHFGKLDLTFPQALALNVLGSEGPMPISKLAEKTGSANSTTSGVVDRLERLGLARRTRSELDHRVIQVEATEKYVRMMAKAETGVAEYFDSLLNSLNEEERAAVARGLELLDQALSGDGKTTPAVEG